MLNHRLYSYVNLHFNAYHSLVYKTVKKEMTEPRTISFKTRMHHGKEQLNESRQLYIYQSHL